jgi:hypothetical protein
MDKDNIFTMASVKGASVSSDDLATAEEALEGAEVTESTRRRLKEYVGGFSPTKVRSMPEYQQFLDFVKNRDIPGIHPDDVLTRWSKMFGRPASGQLSAIIDALKNDGALDEPTSVYERVRRAVRKSLSEDIGKVWMDYGQYGSDTDGPPDHDTSTWTPNDDEEEHPFSEKKLSENKRLRTFSHSRPSSDLVWHRDLNHRVVRVVEGKGWSLQLDNELPRPLRLGETYEIPARHWHRLVRSDNATNLSIIIQELKKGERVKHKGKKATVKVPDARGPLVGIDPDGPQDMNMVPMKDIKKLKEDKIGFGNYDTWSDPDVAYKDSDPNVSDKAQKFAMLMDKVAEELGLSEPVITSGLRPPDRQVKAMINLWKNHGSQYVIDLYTQKCKSCSDTAGQVAEELVALWDENRIPLMGGVSRDIFEQSKDIVKNSPLSEHQNGNALDYGIKTNPGDNIKKMVDYIGENGLATYELIDETQGPGPHWHVSIYSITPAGVKYLKTPNVSEGKKRKDKKENGQRPKTYGAPEGSKRDDMLDKTKADLESGDPEREKRAWARRDRMEKKEREKSGWENKPRPDSKTESAVRDLVRDVLDEELSKKTKATLRKKAKDRGLTPGSVEAEYKKGLAAFGTSGSRKGMTQHQWAMARVNSATPSKDWATVKKSKAKKK